MSASAVSTTAMHTGARAGQHGQAGFSMVEVLISLVLIAVAMFGQIGLQMNALKFGKSGALRSQAVFLANELAERMESNKTGTIAGAYIVAPGGVATTAATDCLLAACNSNALAQYDIAEWTTRAVAVLPGASWQVDQTTTGNPSTYVIKVSWTDRRADQTKTTYSTSGTTETFSLTSTRVIYQ
jgi:type IV pilus assembly protein PilV